MAGKPSSKMSYPSILIGLAIILFSHLTSVFQPFELILFDTFLRLRPSEETDSQITIIGITDEDIKNENFNYPISDKVLAETIKKINQYNPRVIGINLYRPEPREPGSSKLRQIFKTNDKIIGVRSDTQGANIPAPKALPEKQVGSINLIPDADKNYRRDLLAYDNQGYFAVGMTVRIVEKYLGDSEFYIGTPKAPVLCLGKKIFSDCTGKKKLPLFNKNTGAYIRAIDGGTQALVNPRSGDKPFHKISLTKLNNGDFDPSLLKDRIVLIGMTASSVSNFNFNGIKDPKTLLDTKKIHSVEFRAHAISQMLKALDGNRQLIWGLNQTIEVLLTMLIYYILFIIFFNSRRAISPFLQRNFIWLIIFTSSLIPIAFSYLCLLIFSLWIPIFPFIFSTIMSFSFIYALRTGKYEVEIRLAEREKAIEEAFSYIHTVPLDHLRRIQKKLVDDKYIVDDLEKLASEIREIKAFIDPNQEDFLILQEAKIKIEGRLNECLEFVWFEASKSLKRELQVKFITKSFEELNNDEVLSTKDKKDICQFLYEAIINIINHAKSSTHLYIYWQEKDGYNFIRVENKASGENSGLSGESSILKKGGGTAHAEKLAQKINGRFKRGFIQPNGYFCELSWPAHYSHRVKAFRFLKGLLL